MTRETVRGADSNQLGRDDAVASSPSDCQKKRCSEEVRDVEEAAAVWEAPLLTASLSSSSLCQAVSEAVKRAGERSRTRGAADNEKKETGGPKRRGGGGGKRREAGCGVRAGWGVAAAAWPAETRANRAPRSWQDFEGRAGRAAVTTDEFPWHIKPRRSDLSTALALTPRSWRERKNDATPFHEPTEAAGHVHNTHNKMPNRARPL
jgi:hypothetical protein